MLVPNPRPRRSPKGLQTCFSFRRPPVKKDSTHATWVFSRDELGRILRAWNRDTSVGIYSVGEADPFVTAIERPENAPAVPIREHLRKNPAPPPNGRCRVLYHGMGRDYPGLRAIGREGACAATGYDPGQPDRRFRRKPRGRFNEIYSVYTLNVVPERTAKSIIQQIFDLLKPRGRAVISVRRDTCKGNLLPRSHNL